jgi:hypothetical protein
MRILLRNGADHLQIVSRSRVRELRDLGEARDYLAPLLADAQNLAAVREALAVIPMDGDVADELARRLVDSSWLVVPCGDVAFGGFVAASAADAAAAQTTPLEDEEAAAAEQQTAVQSDEIHWIEIELLDDEGKPVAGELYFVELPDGSSISGRTGADGKARVENVDPGTAKVTFPDLDKDMYTK